MDKSLKIRLGDNVYSIATVDHFFQLSLSASHNMASIEPTLKTCFLEPIIDLVMEATLFVEKLKFSESIYWVKNRLYFVFDVIGI